MKLFSTEPALLPSFLLNRAGMGWQCSVCGKLFSISAEEAESRGTVHPPEHVVGEFRMHDCALTFYGKSQGVERLLE